MMDYFMRKNWPAQMIFHNKAMLKNVTLNRSKRMI